MLVSDIQSLAEVYVDDTIEDADAIKWMNDFLEEPDLLEVFRYTTDQSLTVTDDEEWSSRTSGHLGIVQILDSNSDKYTGEYELNYARDKIRGLPADTYTITSLKVPTAITATSDTPAVNTVFHRSAASYMAGKFKCKDNDENPDGLRLVAEGIGKAKNAAKLLRDQDMREQQLTKRRTWG